MIVALIIAKGESGRLPRKNLAPVLGEPMLAHSIRYAKNSRQVDKVVVTTDDDEIARIAAANGCEVVRRGPELGGETSTAAVIDHAVRSLGGRVDFLVCLQPDHPGRKNSLDTVLDYMRSSSIDSLFSVDRGGRRNGSLRILSARALAGDHKLLSYSVPDDCVNVHTRADLAMAEHELSPHAREIRVNGKSIGDGHPIFVIAEGACNHMCEMGMAQQMIESAAEAGADAIKFQTYKAERLVRKEAKLYWQGQETSQIEYYKRLDRFGAAEYQALLSYGWEKGVIVFSTPFDTESASMLNDLGTPLFKIASCDLPDVRLLRHVAKFEKPIILSSGGSTPDEIDRAVASIFEAGNHQLILMACMLSYPTPNEQANLLRVASMKERYPSLIIGLSDHTEPDPHMVIPSLAVALGARAIEKHYTLDRGMTGSGHSFSANPGDLKKMVENIRLTEKVMGEANLGVAEKERAARENARRSIVAERMIRKGEVISSSMLGMKRPADGLPGWMIDQVIGRNAKCDIEPDRVIALEMLE